MRQEHTFGPVYNKNSKILILGSFPSVKSRELNFYYGHPQNRFWKLMSKIYNEEIGDEIDLKKQFLLKNNIALWDTLKSCEIKLERWAILPQYTCRLMRELEIDNKPITADTIKDCFYGRDKVQRSLLEVYAEHNEKCRALIGKEYTESTVTKFDTSINRLKEYIRSCYHCDDIMLAELDGQFIRDFDFWLKTEKHCQNNSALKHLKNLKKVVRIALANDWIKKDPFYGIHFKQEEVNVEFLSREELDILMNKEFAIKRLEQVRDIFIFCCFTALAFVDVQQLSREHLIKDNNGALWIRKARQKTNQMCNIPVLSIPQRILRKYEDNVECIKKGVLLPVISNQRMNAYLKEIADVCGIAKRLTTHVARHTAATVVFLANDVSMENVSKILGHSNIRTTQHYARILDSSIMRDMINVEKNFNRKQ